MAIYYVDFVNGNDGNGGTHPTTDEWKTLTHACSQVLSAGDIIKVRANQTHTYASDINFTSDGTANNFITLKGCDSVDDPWSDGSDVRPIMDFQSASYQLKLFGHEYWKIQRFEITGSTDTYGALYISTIPAIVENCIVHDNTYGLGTSLGTADINDCTFYSNSSGNISLRGAACTLRFSNCAFDGGVGTVAQYGIRVYIGGQYVQLENCTFGLTTAHTTADIYFNNKDTVIIKGRNVILNSTTEVKDLTRKGSYLKIEDDEQTKLANRAWYWNGTIQRGTSDVGGVTHWLRAIPQSNCGSEQSLALFKDLPLWLPASQKTITVSMRANSWAGLPSSSECYIELAYYDGATSTRAKVQSSESFASNDAWTNFTVTITPNSEGPAYLSAYLKDYEDGSESIYVDVSSLPTIT